MFDGTPCDWFWGMSPEWVGDVFLESSAVIGNDSGMAHMAGMLGVPTLAVHAQVKPEQLWNHTDVAAVYPGEISCAGCNWQGGKGWNPRCDAACSALFSVSAERVLKVCLGLIESRASRAVAA